MHTFVGLQLGELDEQALFVVKGPGVPHGSGIPYGPPRCESQPFTVWSFSIDYSLRFDELGLLFSARRLVKILRPFSNGTYDLFCDLMAFHTTCYVVPKPVSHHYDLSYTSTAVPITRYTISWPIFTTGIYYTPWRPPTQLMILTFLTLRLFYAFAAFRLHDFAAMSHFLTLRLIYAVATFAFTTSRPFQQRSISYIPPLYFLFYFLTLHHEPALWARCRDQISYW